MFLINVVRKAKSEFKIVFVDGYDSQWPGPGRARPEKNAPHCGAFVSDARRAGYALTAVTATQLLPLGMIC